MNPRDVDLLRRLAGELAEIAALPVHREKARLWQRLNDLRSERPMVWINEICWHEMDAGGELTLQCEHPWARDQERDLRRTLYQWRHLPGDMIVSDFLACPLAVHSTDFGIIEDVDVVRTDQRSDIVSRHFNIQIRDFADLEKIKMPAVTHNRAATEFRYEAMCRVYEGILPVRKLGQTHIWFTPWDYLIRWWGIQEAMIDLVERPELVHAGVERMVDAWMIDWTSCVEQPLSRTAQHRSARRKAHRATARGGTRGRKREQCPTTSVVPHGTAEGAAHKWGLSPFPTLSPFPPAATIPTTSGRTTCGAARTRRFFPRSRRRCTGSSP